MQTHTQSKTSMHQNELSWYGLTRSRRPNCTRVPASAAPLAAPPTVARVSPYTCSQPVDKELSIGSALLLMCSVRLLLAIMSRYAGHSGFLMLSTACCCCCIAASGMWSSWLMLLLFRSTAASDTSMLPWTQACPVMRSWQVH
jgi:hypothetical protein